MSRLRNLYSLMKYMMMFLSCIILISGFVLLGVGIWINIGTNNFFKSVGDFSSQLGIISTICTAAGASLVILGFIGCYGAWAEKRMFILVYFVIVSLLFLAEIVMALIVLIYRNKVEAIIRTASKQTLLQSYKGPNAKGGISVSWNAVMKKFKCCGVEKSIDDFVGSAFTNSTGLLYPKTCCVDMTDTRCDGHDTSEGVIHPHSCDVKMIHFVESKSIILGAAGAVICVMELASIVISVVLYVRLGQTVY